MGFTAMFAMEKQGKVQLSPTKNIADVTSSVARAATEGGLTSLRNITSYYQARDTYNMDETALFIKATPERTLATSAMPGVKMGKARASLAVCGNASGCNKVTNLSLFSRATRIIIYMLVAPLG
jgi:hypothetical protein